MTAALTDDQLRWLQDFTGVFLTAPADGTAGLLASSPTSQRQPVPPPPPPSGAGSPTDQAEARITTTFGAQFTPVGRPAGHSSTPTAKAWKQDEVDAVERAFTAVPAADKDVLRNVNLSRVTALPSGKDTLAVFEDAADSQSGTVTRTIQVADGNFSASRGQTLSKDEPARGILHEVGHAVVHKARDDAELADVKAIRAIADANAERDQAV